MAADLTQGCMARPSACAFPDSTNTGVPRGTVLTMHEGDLHLTSDGEVIDALDINGCVYVHAHNVTLKRSRIRGGNCPHYIIRIMPVAMAGAGVTIEDVEIDFQGKHGSKGIAFDNYVAIRVHFHGGSDCAHFSRNVVIQDSFCDVAFLPQDLKDHADGFQTDGADNVVLRHNTIRNANSQTSAIIIGSNSGPVANVEIINNLMAGGGYILYCAAATGQVRNISVSNNLFARTIFQNGGFWGPTAFCERIGSGWDRKTNIWDDTGDPL